MSRHPTPRSASTRSASALVVALLALCTGFLSAQGIVLTNVSQVRTLSAADASKHPPVRLRGVVLGEAEPGGDGLAIQDDSFSIYLRGSPSTIARLHPGDLVEVEGAADPGEFAPFVRARTIRKVGSAPVPEPRRVTYEELISGVLDAQWVEVSGIVRYYQSSPDRRKCRLELATGGGRLQVRINRPLQKQAMVDTRIRLRGVCYYLVNKNRQTLRPLRVIDCSMSIWRARMTHFPSTRRGGALNRSIPWGRARPGERSQWMPSLERAR